MNQTARQTNLRTLTLLVVLPFLSGSAALSHELLWTRRLVDLLGATDWVAGRVLGFFFFGISIGGYLSTKMSRSGHSSLGTLARIETLIALLALPAAFLPLWTDWIWPVIGTEWLVSWNGTLIKLLLTTLVVLPPAIAMGSTLPLFIRAAAEQGAPVASTGVWIYTLNTLGGVFGLLFTSTFLIYWLGAQSSMIFTSFVNLFVAGALWRLHRLAENRPQVDTLASRKEKSKRNRNSDRTAAHSKSATGKLESPIVSTWQLYFLSLFSGFVVLSLEVLLLRLISLVVPSSYHTTSALLANVILILAVGSAIVSLSNSWSWTRTLARNKLLVVVAFFGAGIFVALCPMFLYQATEKLISIRYLKALHGNTIDSVGHYWILVFGLVASSGGLALLCSGLVFPALLTISSETDPTGCKIGLLLAANGIGGLAGTELFNSLVITLFGIYHGFILLAATVVIAVTVLLWNANRWFAVAAAMLLAVFVFAGHQNVKDIPYLSPNAKGLKAKAEHFGRDGVWVIVEKKSGSTGILVNNQYFLGGTGATVSQRRQLLLPWILQPKARSVCCLGLATGISAGGLESLDDPPSVTAVEISGKVVQLAQEYFKEESGRFFKRKNNEVIVEDARTYVAASKEKFDLIVGDLYRPYGSGEGRLYSVEHFQNVREALTDNGLFCQWLPTYQLNENDWLTIAATFQEVFPNTLVIYGDPNVQNAMIGLVGRKNDQEWSAEYLDACFRDIPIKQLENDRLLKNANALVVGVLKQGALEDRTINTLDNLLVEISAGRFWILKDLRKKRESSYEDELLSGEHLVQFNERIGELVDSIYPPKFFKRLRESIKLQLTKRKSR